MAFDDRLECDVMSCTTLSFTCFTGERSERGARPEVRGARLGGGEGQQSPAHVRCHHEAHQGSQGTELKSHFLSTISVADPGFPRGGGANPKGRGHQPIIWPISPKNCMPGGGRPLHPL